jgi:hypothetical protein
MTPEVYLKCACAFINGRMHQKCERLNSEHARSSVLTQHLADYIRNCIHCCMLDTLESFRPNLTLKDYEIDTVIKEDGCLYTRWVVTIVDSNGAENTFTSSTVQEDFKVSNAFVSFRRNTHVF